MNSAMKAHELLKRIESKRAPVIVDTRLRSEFKRGHVPGAIHAPSLKILLNTAPLPENKGLEMVLYCGHGQRAWIAKQLLAARGYRNTELLEGHMKFWRRAGLPLEK
jgi:rhodanese-related sulfurtransferase